ncbi:MAG: helix-turn-helix domain-containing protein [Bacilli bacterium]|nr:helix-turn-helix domain-containing protein [Bacilli bacterium]
MAELNEIVANNLVELRKKKQLTQIELAEKIGYSDKSISKWELGKSIPSVDILKQFADFYGVTVDFLITEGSAKKKIVVDRKYEHLGHKITIMSLLVCVVWLIVVAIYVNGVINNVAPLNELWVTFVWGAPAMFIVLSFISWFYWRKNLSLTIFSSLLIWSLIAAFYCQYLSTNIWYIFLIGVPIQAAILLIENLK